MKSTISTPLLALTLLSLAFSSVIFILSLITFSITSLWLNIIAFALTSIYHITNFIVLWRRAIKSTAVMPPASVHHVWSSLICAAFILGTWILALAVTLEETILGNNNLVSSDENAPWNTAVQIAHSACLAIQILVFSSILIHCINRGETARLDIHIEEQPQLDDIYGNTWKAKGIRTIDRNIRPTDPLKAFGPKLKMKRNSITPFLLVKSPHLNSSESGERVNWG